MATRLGESPWRNLPDHLSLETAALNLGHDTHDHTPSKLFGAHAPMASKLSHDRQCPLTHDPSEASKLTYVCTFFFFELLRHVRNLEWFRNDCGAQGTGCVTKHACCRDGIERLETRSCTKERTSTRQGVWPGASCLQRVQPPTQSLQQVGQGSLTKSKRWTCGNFADDAPLLPPLCFVF